jgi:hypothetical protein
MNIRVSQQTKDRLRRVGVAGESYEKTLIRMLDERNQLLYRMNKEQLKKIMEDNEYVK